LGPQSDKYGGSAHFSELVGGGLDLREGVDGEVGKEGELRFVGADKGGQREKFLCGRGGETIDEKRIRMCYIMFVVKDYWWWRGKRFDKKESGLVKSLPSSLRPSLNSPRSQPMLTKQQFIPHLRTGFRPPCGAGAGLRMLKTPWALASRRASKLVSGGTSICTYVCSCVCFDKIRCGNIRGT